MRALGGQWATLNKDLLVWQKARRLAIATYRLTAKFPRAEVFGLTSQLRRAAVSVPSNIAEGQGRLTRGEFLQFLGQARGSLLELETQFGIASELNYITAEEWRAIEASIGDVVGLINRLVDSLRVKHAVPE